MSKRADDLANRLENGARALIRLAGRLTDAEWQTRLPEGRKIGVVVHHVANMWPIEITLAQVLARGEPIVGVTWDVVHEMNAAHARDYDGVTKAVALQAIRTNAANAAAAIRALSDEELDRAAGISLNDDAPLTTQFMLEDHAIRHSYHHVAAIRAAIEPRVSVA